MTPAQRRARRAFQRVVRKHQRAIAGASKRTIEAARAAQRKDMHDLLRLAVQGRAG